MPRPTKQALANRKKRRDATTGKIIAPENSGDLEINGSRNSSAIENHSENSSLEEVGEDWQLWESHSDRLVVDSSLWLLSDDGSSSKRPRNGHYSKTSDTTMWRRRNEAKNVKDNEKLSHYGFTLISKEAEESEKEHIAHTKKELAKIKMFYNQLFNFTKPVMNMGLEGSKVTSYNFSRYLAVKYYFEKRLSGLSKGDSSKAAANFYWESASKFYRPNAIICWAKEFLENQKLSEHSQGAHIKRVSLLSDNDIKNEILNFISKTKPVQRTLDLFINHINNEIIPLKLGVPGTISKTTLATYLEKWGYSYRENKRAIFFDGHEREDVVAYRDSWSRRMVSYMELSEFYEGDELETVLEPVIGQGEQKIVFVTHDECTFYANDGKNVFWLSEEETLIRKKGQGSSIMVSEFQCPCHGTMRVQSWTSRTFLKAGIGRDGWWTSSEMLKQLKEDAIPLFNLLHPGCKAVFLFDNSSNHSAYADDALVASRMPLNEKPWGIDAKYQFKDTEVKLSNGTILKQSFFYEKTSHVKTSRGGLRTNKERYFKGKLQCQSNQVFELFTSIDSNILEIKKILQERNQWLHDLDGNTWKLECKSKSPGIANMCCARHFLTSCEDFEAQKTALQQAVEDAGHIFELYPKYHCECNWIEMYWGYAKREARLHCDYTFSALERRVPDFLDKAANITRIRRYYQRSMRYVEAYSNCSDGREVHQDVYKFVSKKYLSHRKVYFDQNA